MHHELIRLGDSLADDGIRTAHRIPRRLLSAAMQIAKELVRATVSEIDATIERCQERICWTLELDRSTIAEFDLTTGFGRFTHSWARRPVERLAPSLDVNALLPWAKRKMLAGETVVMSRVHELPEEAAVDRESFLRYGPKSNVMIPIEVSGKTIGAMSFASFYREVSWDPRVVGGLEAIAKIFGYGLERKRTIVELQRLRSEIAHVSRVNTVGQLAAAIAHELNQPLAAILSNAETIQLTLRSERRDTRQMRAGVADIIRDDKRAQETIQRLRALFLRNNCKAVPLDIGAALNEVLQIVRADAALRKIALFVRLEPRLPQVMGEKVQFQQAIINLVINAFDALAEADEGPREVHLLATSKRATRVSVFVRDSGKGIAPEMISRIFEPFVTTKPHGMGMGLTITKSIVENHGGQLLVSNNDGRGATFEFRLPLAKAAAH